MEVVSSPAVANEADQVMEVVSSPAVANEADQVMEVVSSPTVANEPVVAGTDQGMDVVSVVVNELAGSDQVMSGTKEQKKLDELFEMMENELTQSN